jgi:hypothetical protein
MRLCDHSGAEFVVLPRDEAPLEKVRRALDPREAVLVLDDLFLGPDGPEGSVRDALLEMAGSSRFDLFWRRSIAELKVIVAAQLAGNGRLVMVRERPPEGVSLQVARALEAPAGSAAVLFREGPAPTWGRPREDRRHGEKRSRRGGLRTR